ncbi:MAG: caspase domain-containing protein [Xanthobacteraceae bacterium]
MTRAKAIDQANAVAKRKHEAASVTKGLPPVITILSPADGAEVKSSEVTVEYTMRLPPGLAIINVRATIDDRPAGEGEKGLVPVGDDSRLTKRVPVPPRDATLSLIAVTEAGVASEPASIRLHWVGPKVQAQLPTLYALVIGISKYAAPGLSLNLAAKDADDFAAVLMTQQGTFYQKVVVKKLTNEEATERNIRLGLEWLKDNAKTREDRAILFFSGHGASTPALTSYLLPQDVDPTKLIATALDKSLIFNALRGLPGKVMVFLDACHAAAGLEAAGGGLRHLDTVGLVNELADAQNGIISFVSSQGSEVSYENAEWNNGAFTKALVDGLSGKAIEAGEHEILTIDLYRWVLKRVGSLTDKRQTPIMHGPPSLAPFPLAFVK